MKTYFVLFLILACVLMFAVRLLGQATAEPTGDENSRPVHELTPPAQEEHKDAAGEPAKIGSRTPHSTWLYFLVICVVTLLLVALSVSVGRGRKRTLIIKAPAKDIYVRMYRWFSLQDHEILQEVANQKLIVRIRNMPTAAYVIIGVVLILFWLVPGILWFVMARGKIVVCLQETGEDTYLTANLNGFSSRSSFNQLVGVLSMLDEK